MSLDQNLFTLVVTPHPENPHVVDLVDPLKGVPYYRKQRVPGPTYTAEIYDPNTESLLVVASAPSATSKTKIIELQNPTVPVELKYTGTLSFKWGFKWEEHEFEWRREECFLIRKPDPAVLVAITKEPSGRLKTTSIQMLDYNLNRFDIEDRKGLEIVILTALLTFNDSNDLYHDKSGSSAPSRRKSTIASNDTPVSPSPPPLPSKPQEPMKSAMDRIAEKQAVKGEINEVIIEDEGSVEDYAQYCYDLLQDDAMLFITVSSSDALSVPKVLQVVEETKRLRYKSGMEDEQLHQYVLYDQNKKKGPRRINLDVQEERNSYEPPSSLSIHLSKIDMPELKPKVRVPTPPLPVPGPSSPVNSKDKKTEKGRKKEGKDKKKDDKDKNDKGKKKEEDKVASSNKLSKGSVSPSHSRIHSYQEHPYQPSPSASQINNPFIYAAPPPPPPSQHLQPQQTTRSTSQFLNSALERLQIPSGPAGKPFSAGSAVTGVFDRLRR